MTSDDINSCAFERVDSGRARRVDGVEVRLLIWPNVEYARGERFIELHVHETYEGSRDGKPIKMVVWPNTPRWDDGNEIPPEEHPAIWQSLIEGMAVLGSTASVHAADNAALLAGRS